MNECIHLPEMASPLVKESSTNKLGQECCSSSVVERVLGKDEAGSSILPCSTTLQRNRSAFIGATLCGHIGHVRSPRAFFEVSGVYAKRVVACVHDVIVRSKRAVRHFAYNPMNANNFSLGLDLAVTFRGRAFPLPTHSRRARAVRNIDLCEKTRNCANGMSSHGNLLSRDCLVRGASRREPFCAPSVYIMDDSRATSALTYCIAQLQNLAERGRNLPSFTARFRQRLSAIRSGVFAPADCKSDPKARKPHISRHFGIRTWPEQGRNLIPARPDVAGCA